MVPLAGHSALGPQPVDIFGRCDLRADHLIPDRDRSPRVLERVRRIEPLAKGFQSPFQPRGEKSDQVLAIVAVSANCR